ncbi:juvenile hormone esterase-like [Microplitis mediator]|uniref:juvenile hormone esterase-like n=1 Tax=Microplitis mediator TaxID=375433 RepID=UPI0025573537|nr:juvenile hormone esterase-like [Microplitis mediator]
MSLLHFLVLTIVMIFFLLPIECKKVRIVRTNKGVVRGEILKTVGWKMEYASFKGIPYAKPPLGRRRFKPPEEMDPWIEIRTTKAEPPSCVQWDHDASLRIYGSEDCLYLNVYSTDLDLRPVMVWIHFGAFMFGSLNSSYFGPDFLVEKDVVVVTMNYRLGAFGFLSLNHKDAMGNAGLKDQVLALKWVQQNIINFGGDPDKVTIFGESAGGALVELHVLSKASRGLFRASIAMSGSPLNFWGFTTPQEAEYRAFRLGKSLGYEGQDKDYLLEYLYQADAYEVAHQTNFLALYLFITAGNLTLPFQPTVETWIDPGNNFLTECPLKLYYSGDFNQHPHILGFTKDEFISLSYAKAVASILEFLGETITNGLVNILSDLSFVAGIDRTRLLLATYGSAPVYYYRNSFDYDQSLHKVEGNNNLKGTGHADDNAHIFWYSNKNQSLDYSSDIGQHRLKMVTMWTNFAKYLHPTPLGEDDPFLDIVWPETGIYGHLLDINTVSTVRRRPSHRALHPANDCH